MELIQIGSSSSSNPTLIDAANTAEGDQLISDEQIAILRGDAIGDTLYSETFVLRTLLNLQNKREEGIAKDPEFLGDLQKIWDMTIEKDVIIFLLKNDVLSLFTTIIDTSLDEQLIEILVGIIANMCSVEYTRTELRNSIPITQIILNLVSCTDRLVLIQLMRFIHSVLSIDSIIHRPSRQWFEQFKLVDNFIGHIARILNNSIRRSLLMNTFQALNTFLTKCINVEMEDPGFMEEAQIMCVTKELIGSVIEAFGRLIPDISLPATAIELDSDESAYMYNIRVDDNDNREMFTDESRIPNKWQSHVIRNFLEIMNILSNYGVYSMLRFYDHQKDLFKYINRILEPLVNRTYLIPIQKKHQYLIANVDRIFNNLNDPFDEDCFMQIVRIWWIIDCKCKRNKVDANKVSDWESEMITDDFNDDADANDDACQAIEDELNLTLVHLISRLIQDTAIPLVESMVQKYFTRVQKELHMFNSLYLRLSVEFMEDGHGNDRLKRAFSNVWNIDIAVPLLTPIESSSENENDEAPVIEIIDSEIEDDPAAEEEQEQEQQQEDE